MTSRLVRPSGRAHPATFYDRPTEVVARELLGSFLEHRSPAGTTSGRIVEVEAYLGPDDPASHSATGPSVRNKHLHGPPGTAYVYLIYGMHYCVNAVTRERGHGSAVLLRALEPHQGEALMHKRRGEVTRLRLTSGPGNLCRAMGIDRALDGTSLVRGSLTIRVGAPVDNADVACTPRIGITQAAEWPLRWVVRGSPFVSGPRALR